MPSKCSSERNHCMSLTLYHKLEMIKFSEEGILKTKIGQKLCFLYQSSCECKRKALERN